MAEVREATRTFKEKSSSTESQRKTSIRSHANESLIRDLMYNDDGVSAESAPRRRRKTELKGTLLSVKDLPSNHSFKRGPNAVVSPTRANHGVSFFIARHKGCCGQGGEEGEETYILDWTSPVGRRSSA